jgi:hypothetical protein
MCTCWRGSGASEREHGYTLENSVIRKLKEKQNIKYFTQHLW